MGSTFERVRSVWLARAGNAKYNTDGKLLCERIKLRGAQSKGIT